MGGTSTVQQPTYTPPDPNNLLQFPNELEQIQARATNAFTPLSIKDLNRLQEEIYAVVKRTHDIAAPVINIANSVKDGTALLSSIEQETFKKDLEITRKAGIVKHHVREARERLLQRLPPFSASWALPKGFARRGANCSLSALGQIIINTPLLREGFAGIRDDNFGDPLAQFIDECRDTQDNSLPDSTTQGLRERLVALFGSLAISPSCYRQEDTHELISLLMGKLDADRSPLFTSCETSRYYEPTGHSLTPAEYDRDIRRGNPRAFNRDNYSRLVDNRSSRFDPEWQLFLDLQNNGEISFLEHLNLCFVSKSGDIGWYLGNDDRIHAFQLTKITRQFEAVPRQLMVVLKRFGKDDRGNGYKIDQAVAVPRIFSLPDGGLKNGGRANYEISSFFVHQGGYGGGHYVSYVLADNDKWYRLNDDSRQELTLYEVDCALLNSYVAIVRPTQKQPVESLASHLIPVRRIPLSSSVIYPLSALSLVKDLENFASKLGGGDKEVRTAYNALPGQISNELHRVIWLSDKMPNILEYGKTACDKDPTILKNCVKPWLSLRGKNIVEQMLELEKDKQVIVDLHKVLGDLKDFALVLDCTYYAKDALKKQFSQLDDSIRHELQEDVWRVQGSPDIWEFGKEEIEKDVCLLKNLSGRNLVQEKITKINTLIEQKNADQIKGKLGCLLALIKDASVAPIQLIYLYNALPIPTKHQLEGAIWQAHKPAGNEPKYGENAVKRDIRCLQPILENLLKRSG